MTDGRLHRLVSRFADVRSHETKAALYFFSFFFLITFPAYIIKPVKDNLLIDLVRPGWWPYADLITAGLIGVVVAVNARLLNKLRRRHYMSAVVFFFISSLFFFWFIFDIQTKSLAQTPIISSAGFGYFAPAWYLIQESWPFPIILFCFWSDVFIATSVTQFWISVNDTFHPHQAKRMVGFFVSGGLLGGIVGALSTSILVKVLGQENLLLVCLGLFFLTLTVINLIYAERKKLRGSGDLELPPAGVKVGYLESLQAVGGNRYLRILAGVLASAMVVAALINFQFKIVLKAAFADSDARASFIASFFLVVLVVSSIFHVFTTDRILQNSGIRLGLLLAPMVLLLGSLSPFLIPASGLLIWACLIRGSDKIFDNTLSQSVRELLYVPVPADIKYKAKMFIDMFVSKFATGFGALIFLLFYHLFHFREIVDFDRQIAYADIGALLTEMSRPIKAIGVPIIIFACLWIFLVRLIYREYVGVVGKDLKRIWEDAHKVVSENVDVDVTRLFFDTVQSQNVSETLYAMNAFDLVQKKNLSPELREIMTCKTDEIKARSMDSLLGAGCEAFIPDFGEILGEEEFKKEIKEIYSLDVYKKLMQKHLGEVTQKSRGTEVERMEAAKLVGLMESSPEVVDCLRNLLQDESAEVLNYALSSAAVHPTMDLLPFILPHLGSSQTRQVAQGALASFGPVAFDFLSRGLRGGEKDMQIRRAIPEVLAKLGTQDAAEILLDELTRGEENLQHELVEALYQIKSSQPTVEFDERMVLSQVLLIIRQNYDLLLGAADPASGALEGEEEKKIQAVLDRKVKRIFDLLSLIYPSEDIVKACQNIFQGTAASVDYSLELLDNVLDKDFKLFLFPLIESLPGEERIKRLKKLKKALDQKLV